MSASGKKSFSGVELLCERDIRTVFGKFITCVFMTAVIVGGRADNWLQSITIKGDYGSSTRVITH